MEDEVIRVVATAAAGLIIRAMGTAAWSAVRDRWATLLGRGEVTRQRELAEQLDESAAVVSSAKDAERSTVTREVEAEWRGELRALLRADPALVAEIQALVVDGGDVAEQPVRGVRQHATVRSGMSIQSGRDTHIGS